MKFFSSEKGETFVAFQVSVFMTAESKTPLPKWSSWKKLHLHGNNEKCNISETLLLFMHTTAIAHSSASRWTITTLGRSPVSWLLIHILLGFDGFIFESAVIAVQLRDVSTCVVSLQNQPIVPACDLTRQLCRFECFYAVVTWNFAFSLEGYAKHTNI